MDKRLKRALVEFVLGERKELQLHGNPRDLAVIHEAATSSRQLVIALESGDPDRVNEALQRKKEAVRIFEQHTSQKWSI